MKHSLAIVIPAYKDSFLREALSSIASQTCQDFTLYIGDDCSPHPIKAIVDEFWDKIDLVYKRFDTNLGGKDLVAQWDRCIAMTSGEQYIWLFSDDDVMEEDCVRSFLNLPIEVKQKYNVFHFNVKRINEQGDVTTVPQFYPTVLESFDYYRGKLYGKYASLVVENIFTRDIYEKSGGFEKFDLAWGSDTATWAKFCSSQGIYTIDDTFVKWRVSSENISPNNSKEMVERKSSALSEFFKWSYNFYSERRLDCTIVNIRAYISRMAMFKKKLNKERYRENLMHFCKIHHCTVLKPVIDVLIIIKSNCLR